MGNLVMLFAMTQVLNRHTAAASVYEAKGASAEATREKQLGTAQAQRGAQLIFPACCCLLPLTLFMLAWFIIGIVMFTKSDGEACDEPKNWFWVIFSVNFVLQCTGSALRPKQKTG